MVRIDFADIQVSLAANPEEPVLDKFGIENVNRKENTRLTFPNGTGDFLKSKIYFSEGEDMSIEDHLEMTGVRYLYCYGLSNEFEPGIDFALIGLLAENNKKQAVSELNDERSLVEHKELTTVFKYMPS